MAFCLLNIYDAVLMREILDNCFEGRIVNANALNKAQLFLCSMNKNAQHECCELSFIWAK